jgi:glycosyltransferase involved in cell wall biosynthesis
MEDCGWGAGTMENQQWDRSNGSQYFSSGEARIAFVQDNFVQAGGGERVAEEIARILPDADVFTTVVVEERLSSYMKTRSVHTTWMQLLPKMKKYYRHYFLFYPVAVRGIGLDGYDLIVSSCSGFAKMLRKPAGAVHICYCHTPTRWIWRYEDYAGRESFNGVTRAVLSAMIGIMKKIDRRAADRVDIFIANSTIVAERIRRYYGRDAKIIFPPIDCSRFNSSPDVEDYYLILSRLVPYKRVDLAIAACKELGRKLVVIGDGPDRRRLEAMAGAETTFLGRAPDAEVAERLSRCKAMLFPGEEDFGLTPLECNASGRPCIAFGSGGALDTIRDGETGVLFPEPTSQSLAAAILQSEEINWDATSLRAHAARFDRPEFDRQMIDLFAATVRSRSRASEEPTPGMSTAALAPQD